MMLTSLRNLIGKPVSYQGKPYMLWKLVKKYVGEVEAFGVKSSAYEYAALIVDEVNLVCKKVSTDDIGYTDMKFDYVEKKWIEKAVQMEL